MTTHTEHTLKNTKHHLLGPGRKELKAFPKYPKHHRNLCENKAKTSEGGTFVPQIHAAQKPTRHEQEDWYGVLGDTA